MFDSIVYSLIFPSVSLSFLLMQMYLITPFDFSFISFYAHRVQSSKNRVAVNMELFPLEIVCSFVECLWLVLNFRILPWFAFKLDHLCLLQWFPPITRWLASLLFIFIDLHCLLFYIVVLFPFLWLWLFSLSLSLIKSLPFLSVALLCRFKTIRFAVFLIISIWRSLSFEKSHCSLCVFVLVRMCASKPIPQINN